MTNSLPSTCTQSAGTESIGTGFAHLISPVGAAAAKGWAGEVGLAPGFGDDAELWLESLAQEMRPVHKVAAKRLEMAKFLKGFIFGFRIIAS